MTRLGPDETYSTDGPQCPMCGFTFTPDDGVYYSDSYTEDECPDCNTKFKVEVHHSVSWACTVISPADQQATEKTEANQS